MQYYACQMDAPIQSRPKLLLQSLGNIISLVVKWLLGIAVLAVVAWWLLPNDWRIKYAAEYTLDTDQVTIDRKPHDCEWDSAPIGNKHCHYAELVTVLNSEGKVIDGTGIEVDASGAQISYDGRRTWQPRPFNQTPAKVRVVWQRVED